MWSEQYHYINIYHDKELSVRCSTKDISGFLRSQPELKQKGDFEFINSDLLPFTEILLLHASNKDSWSSNDTNYLTTNLIAIVCSRYNEEEDQKLMDLFIRIAVFLKWQIVEEQTDNSEEDCVLWQPE
ncbi:MAG TPA: hypothetical protein VNS32_13970 [Flavisolibacter sp.]|nr:hypothetical protein [Flavisolibacter sp.]